VSLDTHGPLGAELLVPEISGTSPPQGHRAGTLKKTPAGSRHLCRIKIASPKRLEVQLRPVQASNAFRRGRRRDRVPGRCDGHESRNELGRIPIVLEWLNLIRDRSAWRPCPAEHDAVRPVPGTEFNYANTNEEPEHRPPCVVRGPPIHRRGSRRRREHAEHRARPRPSPTRQTRFGIREGFSRTTTPARSFPARKAKGSSRQQSRSDPRSGEPSARRSVALQSFHERHQRVAHRHTHAR